MKVWPQMIWEAMVTRFWPEWRNWYTQGTQNPPGFTAREGSNPSSGTSGRTVER